MRIYENTPIYRLLELITLTGEYPLSGFPLLGNYESLRRRTVELTSNEPVSVFLHGEDRKLTAKVACQPPLLVIVGNGQTKGVRFTKTGAELAEQLFPEAYLYYCERYSEKKMGSTDRHRSRYHRCAESTAMFYMAGYETTPARMPALQKTYCPGNIPTDAPLFYPSLVVKTAGDEAELDKTAFTRYTGICFSDGCCYMAYNTRKQVMKWSDTGELKAQIDVDNIARLNAGIRKETDSIFLFGAPEITLKYLKLAEKSGFPDNGLFHLYHHIHFIPMNDFGIRLLNLFKISGWQDRIFHMLNGIDPLESNTDYIPLDFTRQVDSDTVYGFSFMDGDLARLFRFCDSAADPSIRNGRTLAIYCLNEQKAFCEAAVRQFNIPDIAVLSTDIRIISSALRLNDPLDHGSDG